MGICQNKPKVNEPNQRIKHMGTEQRLQPKPSRVIDLDYKQIPNKFKRQGTKRLLNPDFDPEVQGLVGLTNLGNTCFLNSSIQALSNSQPLTDYFLSQLHTKEINPDNPLSSRGEIVRAFATLVRHLWQSQPSLHDNLVIRPQTFIQTVGKFNEIFAQGSQEDAHEFLAFLLDQIHEDLNRIKHKPYVENKLLKAADAWLGYLSRNQSIIVDLFQGQTLGTLQCITCNTARYQFEPFMYLSVPVPSQECNLSDCIFDFVKKEILKGSEGWMCPNCGCQRDSYKKIDLWSVPNLLVIHLKRFKFTATHRSKIRTFVKYPIQNFSLEDICCVKQEEKPTYDLFAVINHNGTLTSGHYTAFAKNRDDLRWYLYNDAYVSMVENPEERVVSQDGYLLFYFKNSVEEFKRQTVEGVKMSQKRRTLKNTIVIKQALINMKSKDSASVVSGVKMAPSVSSQQQKKNRLTRKQTRHFQKVQLNENSKDNIIEEEN